MKITRTRGDTYADQFQITMKSSFLPADLTGCTFKMTLSTVQNPDSNTPMVYQLIGSMSDPTKGIVEFSPTAIQADQVGNFYYDVEMTDSRGAIRTLLLDSYTYTDDITK